MITPERGWNTWHPVSCSRLENLPAGLSIVPGAFSEAESSYTQFPFDTETRLLEHESSGRYCRMRVSHACAEFELAVFIEAFLIFFGEVGVFHDACFAVEQAEVADFFERICFWYHF